MKKVLTSFLLLFSFSNYLLAQLTLEHSMFIDKGTLNRVFLNQNNKTISALKCGYYKGNEIFSKLYTYSFDDKKILVDSIPLANCNGNVYINDSGFYYFVARKVNNKSTNDLYYYKIGDKNYFIETFSNYNNFPFVENNNLYFAGKINDKQAVIKCTNNTYQKLFEYADTLSSLTVHKENILFSAYKNDRILINTFNQNSIQTLGSFNRDTFNLYLLNQYVLNEVLYFNVNKNVKFGYSTQLWQTDLSVGGTKPFLNDLYFTRIYKEDSTFLQNQSYHIVKGFLYPPYNQTKIQFDSKFSAQKQSSIKDIFSRDYVLVNTPLTGYEIAKIENDSFTVFDINKGNFNCIADYNNYRNTIFVSNDTILYVGTNGGDTSYYLYMYCNAFKEPKSIAKCNHNFEYSIRTFFKTDYKWYCVVNDEDSLKIFSILFDTILQKQPNKVITRTDEWHRQIGSGDADNYSNTYLSGLNIDSQENIFISGSSNLNRTYYSLTQYDTTVSYLTKASNFISKFDKYGSIQWLKYFGSSFLPFTFNRTSQCMDKEENIIVTGTFNNKLFFLDDSLVISGNAHYIIKFSGKDGSVIWAKAIPVNNYVSETVKVICDNKNNIFIALMYFGFNAQIGNSNLNSKTSPTNAMVKIGKDGNIIWAKNMVTPWTDIYGETKSLYYFEKLDLLYSVQSQGYYNTSSSCRYQNWSAFLQCMTTNGEILWTKNIEGDDLFGATTLGITQRNELLLTGYFRGKLSFDKTSITSLLNKNGCNDNQVFFTAINPENGEFIRCKTYPNFEYYPFNMFSNGEKNFIVGGKVNTGSYENWGLLTLNENLDITSEKNYSKRASVFDFDFNPFVEYKNGYVITADLVTGKLKEFNNCGQYNNVSIIKFKDEMKAWKSTDYLNPVNSNFEEAKIKIFPNPANEKVYLSFAEPGNYSHVSITDLSGKLIFEQQLSTDILFDEINVAHLTKGLYIISFTGNKTYRIKMFKL